MIALFVLGTYLGYATYRSDSIATPMLIHFLNNFLAIIAFFVMGSDDLIDTSTADFNDMSLYFFSFVILSLIFTAFIFMTQKYYKKNNSQDRRNDYDLSPM